jgi:dihydropteroate synthase
MIMEDSVHTGGSTTSGQLQTASDAHSKLLSGGGHEFAFGRLERTLVMGILNVTPDSFSDGACFTDIDRAVEHGLQMIADGADIIDIGGESTRPGAAAVGESEEIERVEPIVSELAKAGALISVDTSKARVASVALGAGAWMINDVSALGDSSMASALNEFNAPVVLMHMRGTPRTMQSDVEYDDIVSEIIEFLKERIAYAATVGIEPERIVVDPGLGFGKSREGNFTILRRLLEFKELDRPVLIGASRKSFLSSKKDAGFDGPSERGAASLAAQTLAIQNGADIVRVHDVKEAVTAVRVSEMVLKRG